MLMKPKKNYLFTIYLGISINGQWYQYGMKYNGSSETVYYFEGKAQRHQYVMVSVFQEKQEIIYLFQMVNTTQYL